MKIIIEDKRILIGAYILEYDPYYFKKWKESSDHRFTFRNVLVQWAKSLALMNTQSVVYLLYDPGDETCGYLIAKLDNVVNIAFVDKIYVPQDWYDINLDSLDDNVDSVSRANWDSKTPQPKSDFPILFNAQELIQALRDPYVAI